MQINLQILLLHLYFPTCLFEHILRILSVRVSNGICATYHPVDASCQLGFVHGFGVVKLELGINARVWLGFHVL
ncbi:hypothetical protein PILCRDRAFT_713529 [Piloderma croceum F 1598]|uniref:Uncharacterized protein n=1 Tax=Piloderma croceum (strain F 1598) TaxID=765440 RepID=A0A0C3B9Z5_PILCF|nr:hypothetical protein PILCRDRAFT_713529 [Piloderma croceum F 1598]